MGFKYKKTFELLKKLIIPTAIVLIMLIISKYYIKIEYTRLTALVSVIIHGIIGVIIYAIITYKNKALEEVFGSELINKVLRKLHLKK